MTFREQAKSALAIGASRVGTPVVVNSFGRSGSTMLFDAISQSAARLRGRAGVGIVRGEAWRLDSTYLSSGRCYKSHDYPSAAMRSDTRVLYVFGDPVAAAYSVMAQAEERGPNWMTDHCEHLRVPDVAPGELLRRDALSFGDHLQAWLDQHHATVAFVRYEALWSRVDEISSYLGFELNLPERRPRSTAAPAITPEVREAYSHALQLVERMPDWMVKSPVTS